VISWPPRIDLDPSIVISIARRGPTRRGCYLNTPVVECQGPQYSTAACDAACTLVWIEGEGRRGRKQMGRSERSEVILVEERTVHAAYWCFQGVVMPRLRLPQAGIAISLVVLLWSARAPDAPALLFSAQPATRAMTAYKGAGSCSAVACHGGIAPLAGSAVLRNEHTTWISDDRHSRAFQVLFDERSQRIARNLAGDKDPVPAHEDARCLACHTTPRSDSQVKATVWMNQDGVGCESCHGSAEKWLGPHTTRDWKNIAPAAKEGRFGFTNTKNLVRRVELCAGCHVGQDARDGLLPRDVNHDLNAAGHPRLIFEFAAYQENQPKHWRIDNADAAEAAADFPARAWALGQLVSARAALELLRSRATRVSARSDSALPPALPGPFSGHSPWPEFAEFGCFSCHHSLADEPWRRNRVMSGVSPGALAWGSWTYPLVFALLEHSTVGDGAKLKVVQSALQSLATEMSRPMPEVASVTQLADKAIKAIDGVIREFSVRLAVSSPLSGVAVERMIADLNRPEAWSKVASWDHAAQRYLALVPLNQARGRLDPRRQSEQKALSDELHKLLDRLTFPKDFDSPRGFDPGRLPVGR
jgi:Cytochrome c554 and c-prime